MSTLRLPGRAAAVAGAIPAHRRHPGLQLDRLSPPARQEEQRVLLDQVVKAAGDPDFLRRLLERRQRILNRLGTTSWTMKTEGTLTLHLARRGALENVGLALHPLYGFAYLPGSGLKGLAQAWATTIWKQEQEKKDDAQELIRQVFGWQRDPNEAKRDAKPRKDSHGQREDDSGCAGAVVFHDAWPLTWPQLVVDVTTSHHSAYYTGGDAAPGDWEDPVPVSFLAVPTGQEFSCAVAGNGTLGREHLTRRAREWLTDALAWLGAGAKTNAGYGTLVPTVGAVAPLPRTVREIYENDLKLVTPAFLAGADQKEDDCDLRPSTVRGLLRQWWRTRHTGFVDVATLRRLEAAIWGDTARGGALRVTITRVSPVQARLFDHKEGWRPKADFKKAHDLQDPGRNVTQGLFYLAYGMDDGGKRRAYVPQGAAWRVRLVARASSFGDKPRIELSADDVLTEGRAALWLLCRFGGAGAKNRKGYGSIVLGEPLVMSLEDARASAARLREVCRLTDGFSAARAESFSIELGQFETFDVPTSWTDCWFALDQLGAAVQEFARLNKHQQKKVALGLPRKIHGPRSMPMPHQSPATFKPPMDLDSRVNRNWISRHASPVFCHLDAGAGGALTIRVSTFTAKHLPNAPTSAAVLKDLRAFVHGELATRAKTHAALGRGGRAGPAAPASRSTATPALKSGLEVRCRLLEERTAKGGWRAEHLDTGRQGHIINSQDVPADKAAGDVVTLKIASVPADGKTLVFQWVK